MNKLTAAFDLFRKGSVVADPALWKSRSALAIALAGVFAAAIQLAKAYGYELPVPLTHDDLLAIAGGIATVVGLFSVYGTSDKVGLPAKREAVDEPGRPGVPAAARDEPEAP